MAHYWNKDVDRDILFYNRNFKGSNSVKRDIFFEKYIYPYFFELSEAVLNTWHLYAYDRVDMIADCVAHLWSVIDKYQEDKGKGFSYFTRVARNHYYRQVRIALTKNKDVPMPLFNFIAETEYIEYDDSDEMNEVLEIILHEPNDFDMFVLGMLAHYPDEIKGVKSWRKYIRETMDITSRQLSYRLKTLRDKVRNWETKKGSP
jgi:hypothetical protein